MSNIQNTPSCPQGLEEILIKIDGIDLICHFDYEAPEQGSRENGIQMEPDYPGEVILCGVYAGSEVDIQELLSDAIIEEIQAHITHEMESQNDYDY